MPFTYILRCADDTLYVGHTEDLASREQTHNDGRGAAYTAARTPVRMVYAEEHASVASAIAREHQLKTIAFPAISCGVYGYPLEKAVAIAVRETSGFLGEYSGFEKIIFACFDRIMLDLYRQELARLGT